MHPARSSYCKNPWAVTYLVVTEHGAWRTLLVQWLVPQAQSVCADGFPFTRLVMGRGVPGIITLEFTSATGVLLLLLRHVPLPGPTRQSLLGAPCQCLRLWGSGWLHALRAPFSLEHLEFFRLECSVTWARFMAQGGVPGVSLATQP